MDSQPPGPKEISRNERCPDCKRDFESIYRESPIKGGRGHWTTDWTEGRCEPCHLERIEKFEANLRRQKDKEAAEYRRKNTIEILGGIKPYDEFTFERFRRNENPAAFDRASSFNPELDNLFIYGKNRVGKTHLATAIARKYLDVGKKVLVRSMPDLTLDLRKLESRGDFEGEDRTIDRLSSLDVFVLDDLGLGQTTDYIVKILWQILTRRMNRRKNGLIVTSNLTLNDLKIKYGGKIPHRIFEMVGPDNLILFGDPKSFPTQAVSNFE